MRVELEPQLDNLRRELELNKSMLDILNNEVQMLNSEKILLEKRLYTRRNTTPSIIIEEDEEDLEEEKRNDSGQSRQFDELCESCEISDKIDEHNNDVDLLLTRRPRTYDGILMLNKQVEDLTFYVDELKSELEAEREKNNEYLIEINKYRMQIEDLEIQCESTSTNEHNQRLQKEAYNALIGVQAKDAHIADLELKLNSSCKPDIVNSPNQSDTLEKFLKLALNEIIEKKNFDFFQPENFREDFAANYSQIIMFITCLRDNFKKQEDRISNEIIKNFEANKNFETQMERIIRDFREEINNLEVKLNDKQNELNDFKTKVFMIFFTYSKKWIKIKNFKKGRNPSKIGSNRIGESKRKV